MIAADGIAGAARMDDIDDVVISPFGRFMGFRLIALGDATARIACDLAPHHLNRGGVTHGGVLLSLLDDVGGACCARDAAGRARRSMTVDLNARFVGPSRAGLLTATGRRVGGGRTLFFVQSEVRDGEGTLLAFGSSTHRLRREEG